MSKKKNLSILIGFVLAISLLSSAFTAMFMANSYAQAHMQTLGEILYRVIDKQPETENIILETLKEYKINPSLSTTDNILTKHGYTIDDFLPSTHVFIISGLGIGSIVFIGTLIIAKRKDKARINDLTKYLEKVNTGDSDIILQTKEDEFSTLQDEIYKTVTMLHQTKDAAISAKNNFAENLYNIAHQIKTPITSISLSLQILKKENPSLKSLDKIQTQLARLTRLEEALLVLARIDAGTLSLDIKNIDVYTILMLAADNLQELLVKSNVCVDIPELGESLIYADLDWTMEAIINLLKNCMEHTPSGKTIHCTYEQNPIYTQILIWDEGPGFVKEDLPHLFERFYRGQNATNGGIGIGLALSKALIEKQNGTIRAKNLQDGGACFEIRFYSH